MHKPLMVLLCAFSLTGCFGWNKREAPSSIPPPPDPPPSLLVKCQPTPRARNADGSMSKAQVEQALAQGDVDLYECDLRRQSGVDAWPKPPEALIAPESR